MYEIGVPYYADYVEAFSSDDVKYGGTGVSNGTLTAREEPMHGEEYRISIDLPPMAVLYFEIKNKRTPPSKQESAEVQQTEQPAEVKAEPAEVSEVPAEAPKPEEKQEAKAPAEAEEKPAAPAPEKAEKPAEKPADNAQKAPAAAAPNPAPNPAHKPNGSRRHKHGKHSR